MKRASPVEMRKNLALVEALRKAGIDFVPVIVLSDDHREAMVGSLLSNLNDLIQKAEKDEATE